MAKHIGIVACSAEGAALCYQTICKEGASLMGKHNHPEVSIHTYPLGEYMKCIYRNDWNGVAELMVSSSIKLEKAGAQFLICPDNTIHQAFEQVESRSPLPWLHIARTVVSVAEKYGYKKLGILGTKYLMTGPVYPAAFSGRSIDYMVPDTSQREMIDRVIFDELVYGIIKDASKYAFHSIIADLKSKDCDSVVLGCTEIPMIVLPEESPLPVLDSTRILARAALREALK